MFPAFTSADERIARRGLLGSAARAAFGLTLLDAVAPRRVAGEQPQSAGAAIIYLMMRGAMSHIDTFDPKPGREEQGETKVIATSVPGVSFGEHLPRLAGLADRLAVIRSLTTETGAHEQGTYLMRTSYPEIASIRHPSFGSWAVHVLGKRSRDLPGYVLVGNGNEHPAGGSRTSGVRPTCRRAPSSGGSPSRTGSTATSRGTMRVRRSPPTTRCTPTPSA